MTRARNGAASAAPGAGLVYQVQVRGGGTWIFPTELGWTRLGESVFTSRSEADEARERLIEEFDYAAGDVRVRECVVDDERGGLLPVRDPRPRSGQRKKSAILLTLDPDLLEKIDAECEEDGTTSRVEWIREACRAYLLLGKRDKLTDADWRRVVSG